MTINELEEQHVSVRVCYKLGKTFTETFQMLSQAYGKDCMSRRQYYECSAHSMPKTR